MTSRASSSTRASARASFPAGDLNAAHDERTARRTNIRTRASTSRPSCRRPVERSLATRRRRARGHYNRQCRLRSRQARAERGASRTTRCCGSSSWCSNSSTWIKSSLWRRDLCRARCRLLRRTRRCSPAGSGTGVLWQLLRSAATDDQQQQPAAGTDNNFRVEAAAEPQTEQDVDQIIYLMVPFLASDLRANADADEHTHGGGSDCALSKTMRPTALCVARWRPSRSFSLYTAQIQQPRVQGNQTPRDKVSKMLIVFNRHGLNGSLSVGGGGAAGAGVQRRRGDGGGLAGGRDGQVPAA